MSGLGPDLPGTIETILTWANNNQIHDIFCTGQSMGGYGALLFSGHLKAKAIAFGAETVLDLPHSQYARKADRSVPLLYSDIANCLHGDLDAVLVVGEQDPIDIFCAQKLQDLPGVSIRTMRRVGHGPAGYLRNRHRLLPLLENWLDGGSFPDMEEFGSALDHAAFPELYYKGWCALMDKDYNSARTHLQAAVDLYPISDEARRLLGNAYHGLGRYAEALEQSSVSYALLPRAASFLGVATSLRFMDELLQARYAYLQLLKRWPEYAEARYGLGLCYMRLKRTKDALAQFKVAVRLMPNNAVYQSRLDHVCALVKETTME